MMTTGAQLLITENGSIPKIKNFQIISMTDVFWDAFSSLMRILEKNDKFLDVTKCFLVIFENVRNIERIPNASSLAWPNRKCQRQLLCI